MKKYEFKGKSLETGMWICGSLATTDECGFIISFDTKTREWGAWEEVDLGTVESIV